MGQAFAGVWSLAMPALGLDSGLLAVAVLAAATALLALLLVSRTARGGRSRTAMLLGLLLLCRRE